MQYASLALSLAWPQIVVAILWFGVALVALWYRRATGRPVFLFGGIAALMISLSEVLSPLRLAYRYFTHREYCPSTAACANDLQFGAAKFEWLLVGLAAFVFVAGLYLEVQRARRRAAANNAARAAASRNAALAAAAASEQSSVGSSGTLPDASGAALADRGAVLPNDLPSFPAGEQPTFSRRPPGNASSGPF